MKTRILLIVMLVLMIGWSNLLNAQAPNWAWVRDGVCTGGEEGMSVATDASGNVYMTGYFLDTVITFGAFTLTNVDNTGNSYDIFIVKYSPCGNVLWAKSAGSPSTDESNSVSTDASGNVYITGLFSGPSITFGTFTLTGTGSSGVFIVKYDANGNVVWAKRAGGTSIDVGYNVATDANGNVVMTGYFQSPFITFGTTTLTNTDNTGLTADIFIVKYDASGTVLWAKSAGGTSNNDRGYSIITDANDNIFVTGYFKSPSITFDTFTLTNAGGLDIFIVKYAPNGTVIWAKSAGGASDDRGYSVATDASGSVFMTGSFYSPSITFGIFTLTNPGAFDIFIIKYDSSGTVVWAKSADITSIGVGYCIATDASDNVYVTGSFGSPFITFDSDTLFYPSGGTDPMFLIKFNSTGTVLWSKTLASGGDDQSAVAADAFGNIFIGGDFACNPFIVGTDTLHKTGNENAFIAKLGFSCGDNIPEIKPQQILLLSPNPLTTQTMLTLQGIYHNPTLFIYNLLGQEVRSIPVGTNKQITIHRGNLPSGMYFYKLIEDNKEVLDIGKMIIE